MADDKDARALRLAEALRANLRRRKSQARARDAEDGTRHPEETGPSVMAGDKQA
ncbi:MAG TPA: hypothetical protein VFF84_09285 [Sphingobium sp.]|nr:hypothetical protein [Sphingobium sp.]